MKLLIITNIPTPYRIAFFNVIHNQLLSENGTLKVVYCANNEPDRHWKINLEEQQYEYEILKGIHLKLGGLFLHFNPSILKVTKTYSPDIILYAGSWNMPTVMYSLLVNYYLKKKYTKIFWTEGHDGSIIHKKGLVPLLRKFIQNKFDGFAVPNRRSEKYLFNQLKLNIKPIIFLPNTVDGVFYSKPLDWNEQKTIEIKRKFNIPINSKIAIQVAQIEDRKGVIELTNHWSKLSNITNYHLILVGEGSLKENLKKEFSNNNFIHFLGNQPKEIVRELLFASNLFILYTKNDPNPLTLIEASYASLPLVTTVFAGNCNELILNKNGVILENHDYELFSEKLLEIINSDLETMGSNSFENVKENFDIKIVSRNLLKQLKIF